LNNLTSENSVCLSITPNNKGKYKKVNRGDKRDDSLKVLSIPIGNNQTTNHSNPPPPNGKNNTRQSFMEAKKEITECKDKNKEEITNVFFKLKYNISQCYMRMI
jgi:hypothetical protein